MRSLACVRFGSCDGAFVLVRVFVRVLSVRDDFCLFCCYFARMVLVRALVFV